MLIFLLIFLLHYDVFICNGTNAAKFNESLLLDKLYQNLVRVDTVLKEVEQKSYNSTSVLKEENGKQEKKQDKKIYYDTVRNLDMIKTAKKNWNSKPQKNLSAKFHLSQQYEQPPIRPIISDRRQGFTHRFPPPLSSNIRPPLLVLPRPPSGYSMAIVPIKPRPRLRPGLMMKPMHSGLDPRLLSDYRFQNVYLRLPDHYLPKTLYLPRPASKVLNQSSLDADLNSFHQKLPDIFDPFHFPLPPRFSHPAEAWISQAVTPPSSPIRPTNDKAEIIWLTGDENNLYVPTLNRDMTVVNTTPYTSVTSTESTTRMSNIDDYLTVASPGPPVNIGQLFEVDEHGYLYVTVPQKGGTTVPVPLYSTNMESTTAGDVFYGKIKVEEPPPPELPTQRYRELVVRLDEGYMVVFMLELCRLVAVKNKKDVRQALYHTETVYNHWWNNGRLAWIEDPLQTVIWKLVVLVSEGDIEDVQIYASMMFHMLLRRNQTLSSEVNSILDKADSFYNEPEGEGLFNALMEFENYPNTTKSRYRLCESLFESFLSPFRRGRQYRAFRRKKLLKSINEALKTRFPRVLTASTEVKPQGVFQKKKTKNRRPYLQKIMRKRKKHRIFNKNIVYGRQYHPNIDYENSILRSMSPTREQVTFRAMPSKSFRIKTTFHSARAYSFNKRNRKLTHILTTPLQELLDDYFNRINDRSSKSTDYHHLVRKTSDAGPRPPQRDTTPSTGSVLLRSSHFDKNNDRSSKNTGHHFFSRKTSAAEHRPPLRDTTPSTGSVLLRSSYFHRNNDRSSKNTGHHFFSRKTSAAEHRPPLRDTTPATGSVLLRSSYFDRSHDRSSKNTGHHFFSRKTSAAGHRPPLRVTTPTFGSVLLRSSYFDRSHDRSSKNTGHHHFVGKTSAAKHRPPLRDTISSTTSAFLRSSKIVHLKKPRKDKTHYHHLKETSEKSESQKKNIMEKFKAELLRKISAFPTMF